jgi:hypothetical protein
MIHIATWQRDLSNVMLASVAIATPQPTAVTDDPHSCMCLLLGRHIAGAQLLLSMLCELQRVYTLLICKMVVLRLLLLTDLREWVDYHHARGVSRFYIYDEFGDNE